MEMPDEQPSGLFVRVLAIEKAVADLLVAHEITTLEEVAWVPEEELLDIKGLDQARIPLIRQRARSHLLRAVMGKE
jgi:transcription termination/antitermination protein NusA